ncbi:MAG: cytochrome c [Planctomycetota bacterium]
MNRPAIVFATLAAAAFFGGGYVLRRDLRERNLEMLPADMVRSPAAETGGEGVPFADGLVQRRPPAGTVPVDAPLEVFGPGPEEAKRAGDVLANPVPAGPAAIARGEKVFRAWCACCHGVSGRGDGAVTKRGFPPPPTLFRPEARALRDGEIFHLVTHGRKDMPAHAGQVVVEDRWAAVRYVRSLQERVP